MWEKLTANFPFDTSAIESEQQCKLELHQDRRIIRSLNGACIIEAPERLQFNSQPSGNKEEKHNTSEKKNLLWDPGET